MVTSRKSKRFRRSLVVGLLWGCGGGNAVTAIELPKVPRRPDGVLIEPTAALPEPSEQAPARGVVSLQEPLSEAAIRDVVRSYFQAFEREDILALAQLLTPDAVSLDARGIGRGAILEAWKARLKTLNFSKLAGVDVVEIDQVERFDYDDLGVPSAPARPQEMQRGEVYVRVPVATPSIAGERLFGDTITFLLRREEGHFKIAAIGEEAPP